MAAAQAISVKPEQVKPLNIVFDFGAVLLHWQPAQLIEKHLPQYAANADAAAQLAHTLFHHNDWQSFDAGLLPLHEVSRRTAQRLGMPQDLLHAFFEPIGDNLRAIDESVQLVRELKALQQRGAPLGLYFLSNMPEPFSRSIERQHEFMPWFDGGIFSGDVKLIKPDAGIFKLLAEQQGLHSNPILFIDDSLPNVQAAQALGWRTVHCQEPAAMVQAVWDEVLADI
jgi:putative hydrolase of the HAD superfamily